MINKSADVVLLPFLANNAGAMHFIDLHFHTKKTLAAKVLDIFQYHYLIVFANTHGHANL